MGIVGPPAPRRGIRAPRRAAVLQLMAAPPPPGAAWLVVPTYNEAANIEELIGAALARRLPPRRRTAFTC